MTEESLFRDQLAGALVGLARASEGKTYALTEATFRLICQALAATVSERTGLRALQGLTEEVHLEKQRLAPDCAVCASPCGRTADCDITALRQTVDGPEMAETTEAAGGPEMPRAAETAGIADGPEIVGERRISGDCADAAAKLALLAALQSLAVGLCRADLADGIPLSERLSLMNLLCRGLFFVGAPGFGPEEIAPVLQEVKETMDLYRE